MRLACQLWRLAATSLLEVRDGEAPSPAREARALPKSAGKSTEKRQRRLEATKKPPPKRQRLFENLVEQLALGVNAEERSG